MWLTRVGMGTVSLSALGVVALVGMGSSAAMGVTITNGSMTGPVGAGLTPPGWTVTQGSPDTADSGGPFNNTGNPWVLSPDGGTFVRAIGPSAGFPEAMSQTLTGLSIGTQYQIDFFQTNLAFLNLGSGDWWASLGRWDFFLDGGLFGSSGVMAPPATAADPNVWAAGAVTFTATATSQELKLSPLKTSGTFAAYMGIDGVGIRAVPGPGVAGLVGLGGFVVTRRRRRVF